jgi:hypothetical protein
MAARRAARSRRRHRLAAAAIEALRRFAGGSLPRLDAVAVDAPVAGAAVAALLLLSFGFVAASTRRARRLDLEATLRAGSPRTAGGGRSWWRALPLAVQATATFLLLAAVALVGTSPAPARARRARLPDRRARRRRSPPAGGARRRRRCRGERASTASW